MAKGFHLVPFCYFSLGVDWRKGLLAEQRKGFAGFKFANWFLGFAGGLLGRFGSDPFFFFFEKFFDSSVGQATRCANYHPFFWVDLDAQSATR